MAFSDMMRLNISKYIEYLYFQLDRRIQLQKLAAGSIPRNSKFCVHIPKVSVMIHRHTSSQNLQKEVSTVGSPEEPTHRTPTYDPIYGGGNGPQTEGIQKKIGNFWGGESWSFSLSSSFGREFSLHIQLGS